MDKLEHNIKNAFDNELVKTRFQRKHEMWKRMDKELGRPAGVSGWWRIAAVFLIVVLAGSVVAGLNSRQKQTMQSEALKKENLLLQQKVDSLNFLPVRVEIETKFVEKIVYRDRIIEKTAKNTEAFWQHKYQILADSTVLLLASQKQNFEAELIQLSIKLDKAKYALNELQKVSQSSSKSEPFHLRGERVELGIQKKPSINNAEMELKIFPKNFMESKNNLNKTLFKY